MNKALVRPLILILVFFMGLYVLREPLRNIGSNFALLKFHYINPVIAYVKGDSETGSAKDSKYQEIYDGEGNKIEPLPNNNPDVNNPNNGDNNSTGSGTTNTGSTNNQQGTENNGGAKGVIVSRNTLEADSSNLSINGVLVATNKERVLKQFPALKLNTKLNKAAELKLLDMFTNQYFQHVSPGGVGVSDLVRKAGYEYIVVGENLALGNFGGDIQVVTAWMNSPGHRANILDSRYQEIGIAVGKGMYNGREQWIAVQHFGKPLSSCEGPNDILKDKIAIHTNELAVLELELTALKKEIEGSVDRGPDQESRINKYNNLVVSYNNRLEGLKDEITTYNAQVRTFNTCAGLK